MRAPRKLQERDAGARIERSEDTVRFVISIIAALMILSLAAFAVVSAQKMATTPAQRMNSDSHDKAAWHRTGTADLPHDR